MLEILHKISDRLGAPEVELFTNVLRGLASDLKKIASSIEVKPPAKSVRSQSGNSSVKNALSKSLSQITFLTESMSQAKLKQIPSSSGNAVLDRIKQSVHQELEICIDAYYTSENVDPLQEDYFGSHCDALIAVTHEPEAIDPATGANALFFAAGSGSVELTLALMKRGFSANSRDKKLRTPLYWAVGRGHAEICAILIANGARYYVENALGNTVLHLAAQTGHVALLPLLLRGFETADIPGKDGKTPLHIAVIRKNLEVVKVLLDVGASAEFQDARGWTALHHAIFSESLEISSLLISLSDKSLREIRDREGLTASDLAVKLSPGNTKLKIILEEPQNQAQSPPERPPQLLLARHDKICMQVATKAAAVYRVEVRDCQTYCVRQCHLKRGTDSVEEAQGMVTLWIPASHLTKGRNFQVRLAGELWSKPIALESRRCAICPSFAISDSDNYCQLHLRKN